MAIKKSKSYEINGEKVAFEFEGGKIIGIKKQDENGVFKPVNPNTSEFGDLAATDEALNAYNIAKHTSAKNSYEDTAEQETASELQSHFQKEDKKLANEQFLEDNTLNKDPIAFTTPESSKYKKTKTGGSSDLMAYPLDIDLDQDHFKITRYNYVRPDINQSKPRRKQTSLY